MISILYVDGDPRMRESVRTYLETGSGMKVKTAGSMEGALNCSENRHFDVIVSDFDMTKSGERSLYSQGRGSSTHSPPVIIFAKRNGNTEILSALSEGAVFYVSRGEDPGSAFPVLKHYILQAVRQLRTEEELKTSEKRYRSVVEDQSEFIVRFRPDGRLVFANSPYLRYISREQKAAKLGKYQELPPFGQKDRFLEDLKTLSREHPSTTLEMSWVLPDGKVSWQSWENRGIFDDSGNIIEYQSVGRDITEQKTAEFALREALKNLGIMNSITRHDILNQITAVFGYLDSSLHACHDPEVRKYLQKAIHAAETIRDQILFTRDYQEIGSTAPRWQNIDHIFSRVAASLDTSEVTVKNDLADLWVYADPLIEKVFFNLLENSLRHGGKLTEIRIFWQESDSGCTIIYEDNGVGIPENAKEKIFHREYFHNTGLGLYLSREILAITKIEIRETGLEGRGARFEIAIPKGVYGWRMQENAETGNLPVFHQLPKDEPE